MKNNKPFSIKRRLTLSVIAFSFVLIATSLLLNIYSAKHEVEEVYDARLGQSAKLLLISIAFEPSDKTFAKHQKVFESWMRDLKKVSPGDDDTPTSYGHPYEESMLFQFYHDGKLLWSSNPSVGAFDHDKKYSGYGNVVKNGVKWRYFQLPMPDKGAASSKYPEYVIVAEKQSIRQEMVDEMTMSNAIPQLLIIPCLVILIILLINKNFKPVKELKLAIAQRSANKLDHIYVANQTVELSPLVEALNELLSQLDLAWQREKRFTRMAAHELKTPLTILRLNAENAINSQSQDELASDLNNILKGIDRTDRLLHQLLTLAKVESLTEIDKQQVDISATIRRIVADLAPLALRNNQEIEFEGDKNVVDGDETLLSILFSNLIDNAIRYSGQNSHIGVHVVESVKWIEVHVFDNGEDISDEAREKLFDNFYRANSEKGDGAGLGMSITRDIANLHKATVSLMPRNEEKNTFVVRFSK
ncbi:ATP-binding protein [Vibrio sp. S4M6]|uniref:ATP-binding protein n=1 Tax=Vibrio sinus TaxID=2946865 RepID=UPI002029DE1D|nr:ATP-binding protein [Vibrio sinus]MCL9781985.1 ATP-binding protein [Vibrio sinus]